MNRQGAKGALLDVYEQAISELKTSIGNIPDSTLTIVTDPHTVDANCRSLQAILTHVVHAGYGYATAIHNSKGDDEKRPDKVLRTSVKEYLEDLDRMFAFTEKIFKDMEDTQ